MRRIHHDGPELITPAGERGPDSCKVLAFMRGEGAADVFEHDHARWSTFGGQGPHQLPERPERPRPVTLEALSGVSDPLRGHTESLAEFSHSLDPEPTFKLGQANGREARESGPRVRVSCARPFA
jgi:hypothetical protein